MMVNRIRGEVAAVLDGKPYKLCLTLGALAELEASLGASGIGGLANRLGAADLSASDALAVLGAALQRSEAFHPLSPAAEALELSLAKDRVRLHDEVAQRSAIQCLHHILR